MSLRPGYRLADGGVLDRHIKSRVTFESYEELWVVRYGWCHAEAWLDAASENVTEINRVIGVIPWERSSQPIADRLHVGDAVSVFRQDVGRVYEGMGTLLKLVGVVDGEERWVVEMCGKRAQRWVHLSDRIIRNAPTVCAGDVTITAAEWDASCHYVKSTTGVAAPKLPAALWRRVQEQVV